MMDACPLGHGARISGEPDPYGVVGIYDREAGDGDIAYRRVDGGERLVWHASSCGWVVLRGFFLAQGWRHNSPWGPLGPHGGFMVAPLFNDEAAMSRYGAQWAP